MEQHRDQVTKEIIDSGSPKCKGERGKPTAPIGPIEITTGKPRGRNARSKSRSSKDGPTDDINMI